jgi:hypothetical protein
MARADTLVPYPGINRAPYCIRCAPPLLASAIFLFCPQASDFIMGHLYKFIVLLLVMVIKAVLHASAYVGSQIFWKKNPSSTRKTHLLGAPKEALKDIVIPNIFPISESSTAYLSEEDPRLWVPQTDCLAFRPLCLCVSHGYYVNLLKFNGGGTLSRHRHSSPVHALTLKGNWRCKLQNTKM